MDTAALDADGRWNLFTACAGCRVISSDASDAAPDIALSVDNPAGLMIKPLDTTDRSAPAARSKQVVFAGTDFYSDVEEAENEESCSATSSEPQQEEEPRADGGFKRPKRFSIISEDRELFNKSLQETEDPHRTVDLDGDDDDDVSPVRHPEQEDVEFSRLLSFRRVHKGVCWKLVSDHVDSPCVESMSVVGNWRRREFVVKKGGDHVGILYSSEKNNGNLGHACTLRYPEKSHEAIFEELPSVAMQEMDDAAKLHMCRNLHTYDLSTRPLKALKNTNAYKDSLPDVLYPLHITWLDVHTTRTCHTVLGMSKAATRSIWLNKLRTFVGSVAPAAQ